MTYDRSTTSGQVPTWGVSIETVMSSPEFKRGLDDVRNGVAFDWRIDEWEYERGRLFGFGDGAGFAGYPVQDRDRNRSSPVPHLSPTSSPLGEGKMHCRMSVVGRTA